MKFQAQLQQWRREWSAYCSTQGAPVEETLFDGPTAPASANPPPPAGSPLTVGVRSNLADMILEKMRNSVAPDMEAESRQRSLLQVGAGPWESERARLIPKGYILQLRPKHPEFAGRDLFVLVLESESPTNILVVPFGPVPVPAFVSEMDTGMEDEALRVLCLWNSQSLPWAVAAHSWHIADASPQLLEEIATLRACLASQKTIPTHLAGKIGPAALTDADERFVYLAKEEEIWNSYLP